MKKTDIIGKNILVLSLVFLFYGAIITFVYFTKIEKSDKSIADIVFVFDTTGSMADKINDLLNISRQFVIKIQQSSIDYRLGFVSFGCIEEANVIRNVLPLTKNVTELEDLLRKTQAWGGGSEDPITALNFALTNFQYRTNAKRIFILITDEDYSKNSVSGLSFNNINHLMQKNNVLAYVVAPAFNDFQNLATQNHGKFYDIFGSRNFTDIIMNIGSSISKDLLR